MRHLTASQKIAQLEHRIAQLEKEALFGFGKSRAEKIINEMEGTYLLRYPHGSNEDVWKNMAEGGIYAVLDTVILEGNLRKDVVISPRPVGFGIVVQNVKGDGPWDEHRTVVSIELSKRAISIVSKIEPRYGVEFKKHLNGLTDRVAKYLKKRGLRVKVEK